MSPRLRLTQAVAAGFVAVAALSIAMDAAMHGLGLFPPAPQVMSEGLFAFAAAYRALFTVAGGALATWIARRNDYRAAMILSGLGLLGGLAGVAAWSRTPELGPLWYALSIPASAIPCTLLGAWAVLRGQA
jgi:hypothetical protein